MNALHSFMHAIGNFAKVESHSRLRMCAMPIRDSFVKAQCFLECYAEYLTQIHERVGIDRAMKTLKLRTYQQTLLREYVRRKYKFK